MKWTYVLLIGCLWLNRVDAQVAPSITTQPTNQTVVSGGAASFSVSASGSAPLFYLWFFNSTPLSNIVATVAGGYIGDNLQATNASFSLPISVTEDKSGDLIVADGLNYRVRMVMTNGVIKTIAGTGTPGFSGDGGAATNAEISLVTGVAVDGSGKVYIADMANNRVRVIGTNGVITTAAGNGSAGYSGDGGAATNATFNFPFGISLDQSGNVYIADIGNNCVRKVNTSGVISTLAGNGTNGFAGDGSYATNAELSFPTYAMADNSGNLLVADLGNARIREVNASGIISTFAGNGTNGFAGDGGAASAALLDGPMGLVENTNGIVFIADTGNNCIRMVATNGVISTIAGIGTNLYGGFAGDGGQATNCLLNLPTSMTIGGAGNILVADAGNARIRSIDTTANISTIAGGASAYDYGDGQAATNALLAYPQGVAFDSVGNLYISDTFNNLIRKVDTNGVITTVVGTGDADWIGDGDFATNATLYTPGGIAFDSSGNMFIADSYNCVIREVDTNGIINTVAGNGYIGYSGDGGYATNAMMNFPTGVAVDTNGNLFITDEANNVIRKVAPNGIITTIVGNSTNGYAGDGGAATNASLNFPTSVVLDGSGNIFIADTYNNAIREVNSSGIISTIAGSNAVAGYSGDGGPATNALLNFPNGVTTDGHGNLLVADTGNAVVRNITSGGTITTIAGDGSFGNVGDGGPALNAEFGDPTALALDARGDLFITDPGNNRIREVFTKGSPVLTIKEASVANQGYYDVLITNNYGSVTSSVVSLTVQNQQRRSFSLKSLVSGIAPIPVPVPSTLGIERFYSGGVSFASMVKSNWAYQVQYTTNINSGIWINLGQPMIATNNTMRITDSPNADRQRFYRLKVMN